MSGSFGRNRSRSNGEKAQELVYCHYSRDSGAVSAYLVGRLGLQLLKDLERLLLCRKGAHLDYWAVIG